MIEEFDDISKQAQIDSEEVPLGEGAIWNSDRLIGPAGCYESKLPAGLHISMGKARMRTHSDKYGGFETSGPSMSFVKIEEDGGFFNTEVDGGAIRSFGYFLPSQAIKNASSVIQKIDQAGQNKPMIMLQGEALRAATRLLSKVGDEYQGDVRAMLLQARALELIALVGSAVEASSESSICSLSLMRARRARDYIESHLDRRLELRILAQQCEISERTLTQAFRAAFDESVMQYIARRRLEEGALALQEGANIAAAAYKVGYTPNAFSAAFKKHFQISPSQYSRSNIAGTR